MIEIEDGGINRLRSNAIISGENASLVLENYRFIDATTIARHLKTFGKFIFRNCIFEKSLIIKSEPSASRIEFDNCTFKDVVQFEQIRFEMSFEHGCQFDKDIVLNGALQNFQFGNFGIKGSLIIRGHYLALELLNINGKNNIQQAGDRMLLMEEGVARNCNIENCIFGQIEFGQNWSVGSHISIIRSDVGQLNIMHIGLQNWVYIKYSRIAGCTIDNLKDNRRFIEFSHNDYIGSLHVALHQLDECKISNCKIDSFWLWGQNRKENIINIENSSCSEIYFDNVSNDGRLTLRDIKLTEKGRLKLWSSNLGKMDFIGCDFSNGILDFQNSKLTELFLAETKFPERVQKDSDESFSQAQLAFGQIHTAYAKQGDTVRSLEYQSREIEAHYRDIKSFKLPKYPFINFTKLNLWLNKISNNFGRDWVRGIAFTFAIGLFFFYCLVISTNRYYIGCGFSCDQRLVGVFFRFMNPLRFIETDSLFKGTDGKIFATLGSLSYVYDFIGRIFIAYGVYQTIQAFRRYGRK